MITITLTEEQVNRLKQFISALSEELDEAYGEIDNKYDDDNIRVYEHIAGRCSGFHQALDMIGLNLYDYE